VPFSYDPEFAEIIAPFAEALTAEPVAAGDWERLRETVNAGLALLTAAIPEVPDVDRTDIELPGYQGAKIAARLYRKTGSDPGSALLYIHGGGMVAGSLDLYDKVPVSYVAETGVPMLSVDYRLAPEHPHPVPVEDCFAALLWLHDHGANFGLDRARIGVMGDSAGGGLAAGTAILARNRALPLVRQILIYPMLDDRNVVPDPELVPFALWTYDGNLTGWGCLWAASAARMTSRPQPLRLARPTSAASRPPTSRSASWTSSATRTCSTRAASARPASPRNCTCIPACRTASTRPGPAPPSASGHGRTGSG
jgi:acetyl esterase/lipase